ncbi:MAG: chromosomal replication initiator protein DnaA [Bilifractor sp.]|jgi:chromosomal replication initiator protein
MLERIKQHWAEILEYVRDEMELGEISYKTWITPLTALKYENDTVYIGGNLPKTAINYLDKKYGLPIQVAIAEVAGIDCKVKFIVSNEVSTEDHSNDVEEACANAGLNPKYTFDTFVVGSNNKFAHAAALAVAESPGEIYNPLFVYGGVGLGKTHLMHSIAHFILEQNPQMKVLYVTSEEFTNEVIEAIRSGNSSVLTKFRDKYRNIDVLLIDDIQFIIGKESTQEEFFHTFNALHSARKQIILSSDRPPKEFDVLEERIKSRFEWGLMADIQSPDYETRMAILRKKQELDGFRVDDKVLEYIASNITSNIRELEGSLNKVIAKARLEKREINVELAEVALADILTPHEQRRVTPDYILDAVAEQYNITVENLKSNNRSKAIAYPRQVAMYLIRTILNTNYRDIGVLLGDRDHSTVMHGVDKISKDYQTDSSVRSTIDLLKKKINPG